MKVILSVDAIKFPLTGIGRYSYELAKQLQLQNNIELLFFNNGRFTDKLPELESLNPSGNRWLHSKLRKNDLIVQSYQWLTELKNKYALKGHEDAVFHGPKYYLPRFNGFSVATFHDLSIFTHKQYHPPERVRFMEIELSKTLLRAKMLITDSEFTRQELATYFGYPLSKIRSVPLACSDDFHPRDEIDALSVLSKFGLLYGKYTLYAGTIEPRKNIASLLNAYSALPNDVRERCPLVLVGYHGWQSEDLHERIEAAQREGWVRYFGYVTDNDLPYLYSGASLFFFPSHYEGFGLPVLEAMASGVPVICSNASSLPEVVGDAALMFEPNDVDALVKLILMGLEDDTWRMTAIEKGLRQASNFCWEQCALQTVEVYRELLTGKI